MVARTLIDDVRDHLRWRGIARAPDEPGPGARPWLPPVWRQPADGPVGPGDAKDEQRPEPSWDDGTVLSLMFAPGIPPSPGLEELREDGVDLVIRGRAVGPIAELEARLRDELLGDPPDPGGRADWTLLDTNGDPQRYVIQSRQWRPFQPVGSGSGIYTFSVGYVFITRA